MRVQLFGVGLKGKSPAVTAQSRINCYVEEQKEQDRTNLALIGTPGLTLFNGLLGANTTRGIWSVNSLATPLSFLVQSGTLYFMNNAGVTAVIGAIGTTTGDVSFVDNGTFLMLVDGVKGYYYNMLAPAGLNAIVDPNFPTNPKTVTWQDTYFIVNNGTTNQFNLSLNATPVTWPAVNINFTGSAPGSLQACLADHSTLLLFGDFYAEFWQDLGAAGFPYGVIPGSAQEYGLASPWSLCKYDNSIAGLFKNKMGEANISRMSGFTLKRLSSLELEAIINDRSVYTNIADAQFYAYMQGGHPMLQCNFPTALKTWLYDGASGVWSELRDTNGSRHWGQKFATFVNNRLVTDYRNGNIYKIDPTVFSDNGSFVAMEVTSKHIWNDDKYISIPQLQVDVQAGAGIAIGQGSNPQMDLLVSKDGGNTFTSVGFSSIGAIGAYTQRVIWRRLGRARDWVLRLRISDPIKRILTGASAEIEGGSF